MEKKKNKGAPQTYGQLDIYLSIGSYLLSAAKIQNKPLFSNNTDKALKPFKVHLTIVEYILQENQDFCVLKESREHFLLRNP